MRLVLREAMSFFHSRRTGKRFMRLHAAFVITVCVCLALPLVAQNSNNVSVSVPPVIQFSGVATDQAGSPLTGTMSITFSLYNNSVGGAALWSETQNVTLDPTGHYSVYLGLTQANGVPASLFTSGEAHWLGVKIGTQAEQQPRIFLVSVPYAMKAGDAATVGGLPPSAFVMAAPATDSAVNVSSGNGVSTASSDTSSDVTTTGGTVDTLPLFTTATNVQSSIITQTGSGSTGKIGINTATPATTLDVKGGGTIRGTLTLPANGTATATAGKNSQPLNLAASAFNSTTSTAVNQVFQWEATPAANDTSTPSGTLNLLFGEGATAPSQTGLSIASNGQVTFATGQTFPGTGDGTVTSVASGAGLTGGPITSTGTLSIATGGVTNSMLANSSLTVSAGTGMTGGGAVSLGGNTTLNVDTTKVPLLAAANTFTGNQTVNGNVSATGVVTGTGFQIGSNLFDYGSYASGNAFLGFAGNTTTTGFYDTASGFQALYSNTSGPYNTATGYGALSLNTTGYNNTATGAPALSLNTTGYDNTATGAAALYVNTTGALNTATGFNALSANTTGGNNTASGSFALYSNTTGPYNTATGYEALYSNTTANYNTATGAQALYYNTGEANMADGAEALYSNTSGAGNTAIGADACYSNTTSNYVTCLGYSSSSSDGITNATAIGARARVEQSNSLVLGAAGVNVGIGTTKPSSILTIGRGMGHPVSDSWETYSSRRWKTNIQTLPDALSKVERLRGVSYDLKDSGKHEIGVIAEEVGAVVPEIVSYEQNGKDAAGVDYSRLTALLIEAVKQQQREISTLRKQLRTRVAKEAALESRLEQLEQKRGEAQLASAHAVR
jgi:hypothetical protein